jgi:hypothetical protein
MLLAYVLFRLPLLPPQKTHKSVLKLEFYIFLGWRNLIILCEGYKLWTYVDLVRQVPHVILKCPFPVIAYSEEMQRVGKMNFCATY